jgi:hypothetical protein
MVLGPIIHFLREYCEAKINNNVINRVPLKMSLHSTLDYFPFAILVFVRISCFNSSLPTSRASQQGRECSAGNFIIFKPIVGYCYYIILKNAKRGYGQLNLLRPRKPKSLYGENRRLIRRTLFLSVSYASRS